MAGEAASNLPHPSAVCVQNHFMAGKSSLIHYDFTSRTAFVDTPSGSYLPTKPHSTKAPFSSSHLHLLSCATSYLLCCYRAGFSIILPRPAFPGAFQSTVFHFGPRLTKTITFCGALSGFCGHNETPRRWKAANRCSAS